MPIQECPHQDDLARFLTGKLDGNEVELLANHVDSCSTCQETVALLSQTSDTFVSDLRAAHRVSDPLADPGLAHAIRRTIHSIREVNRGSYGTRDSTIPARIGPYEIESLLGWGGMGAVYRATHTRLKRPFALKVLPAHLGGHAQAILRFEREMAAVGRLDHRHIVLATDAGEDAGSHYLAMEFVDGIDLSKLVRHTGKLPVGDACELARQAALGLHYVHEHGLVHRDMKPSNLMLAWDHRGRTENNAPIVKILDLGLAVLTLEIGPDDNQITTMGQVMGTLDYMAPEQGETGRTVDHRADIYGLGATLFKLLSGRVPYGGPQHQTVFQKMSALATQAVPSLGKVSSELPTELVAVVDRMLSRDPAARFASARDVADALMPWTTTAQLAELLRHALEKDRIADFEPPASSLNAPYPPTLSTVQPTELPKDGHTPEVHKKSFRYTLATGIALLGIACAAVLVYRISTDYGEIVVRSEDPSATVEIRQGGQVVEELSLTQGTGSTIVRAGSYEIGIKGNTSQLSISPPRADVVRRSRVDVAIERMAQSPLLAAPPNSNLPDSHERVQGKTFTEWLEVLRTEVDRQKVLGALQIIVQMANYPENAEHAQLACDVIIEFLRTVDGNQFDPTHSVGFFEQQAKQLLEVLPVDIVSKSLTDATPSANSNLRTFLAKWLQIVDPEHRLPVPVARVSRALYANGMLQALFSRMKHGPWEERQWAIEFCQMLFERVDTSPQELAEFTAIVREMLASDDSQVSVRSGLLLANIEPGAPGTVEAIEKGLASADVETLSIALGAISKWEGRKSELVPGLLRVISRYEAMNLTARNSEARRIPLIVAAVGAIGQPAYEALPLLRDLAKRGRLPVSSEQLETLLPNLEMGNHDDVADPAAMPEPEDVVLTDELDSNPLPPDVDITSVPTEVADNVDKPAVSDNAPEPLYDGRPLSEWLSEMQVETNPQRLEQSLKAIQAMAGHPASRAQYAQALDAIFQLMRKYGPREYRDPGHLGRSDGTDADRLCEFAQNAIIAFPESEVATAVLSEIKHGNRNSRNWLFRLLMPTWGIDEIRDDEGAMQDLRSLWMALQERSLVSRLIQFSAGRTINDDDRRWALGFALRFCVVQRIDYITDQKIFSALTEGLVVDQGLKEALVKYGADVPPSEAAVHQLFENLLRLCHQAYKLETRQPIDRSVTSREAEIVGRWEEILLAAATLITKHSDDDEVQQIGVMKGNGEGDFMGMGSRGTPDDGYVLGLLSRNPYIRSLVMERISRERQSALAPSIDPQPTDQEGEATSSDPTADKPLP